MALAVTEYATRDGLMQAAAQQIADALADAIARRGEGCAALSGGSTPEPAYRALAKLPLDWPKIALALVDERFVPPSHSASNQAMIETALAAALGAGAQLRPMYAAASSAAEAADIANALYAPLAFDIAVMGMGADGHTASWFAGADALDRTLDLNNPRTVISLHAAQADGSSERLTLTRSAVCRARRLLLLLTGADKRRRLEGALSGDWAPVTALFDRAMPRPAVLWAP